MIEVMVSRLGLDSSTQSYVVILQEKEGERLLPIWIGQPEAESIVMQMHNIKRARPLTHDLCKSLIVGLGGELQKVHITRVEKNTYYAELHIARNGTVVQVDARPSDSIALALRMRAPIFTSDQLLDQSGVEADDPSPNPSLEADKLKEYLERMDPQDFGKFNP
jgi:bifunctional DNase/RNase